MDKKVNQKKTQVPKDTKAQENLIGLVAYLINLDKSLLNPANASSMSDNNGGRIIY